MSHNTHTASQVEAALVAKQELLNTIAILETQVASLTVQLASARHMIDGMVEPTLDDLCKGVGSIALYQQRGDGSLGRYLIDYKSPENTVMNSINSLTLIDAAERFRVEYLIVYPVVDGKANTQKALFSDLIIAE